MSSFFLALVAVLITSLGARDQVLVARLSDRLGAANGLLVTGAAISIITALGMAWAGQLIAAILPASAKMMLVAFALLFAAIELLWPIKSKRAEEPTHSLGAIALVLFTRQIGDAARFCVFALSAATGSALLAAIGGALGGIAAIAIGWGAGSALEENWPLRPVRVILGVSILVGAVIIGLSARGVI